MPYSKENTRVDRSPNPYHANYYSDKNCTVCGDVFKSSRDQPHGKYCSQRCINDAYMARRRARAEAKRASAVACAVCATPMPQGTGKIRAYCTGACKQKAYRMRKLPTDTVQGN